MQDIRFDSFYKYDEMVDFLKGAAEKHGDYFKMSSICETIEGRSVFLAEITDFKTGPGESKGAYYLQAGIHAKEAAGTTVALHLIHTLLNNPEYKGLLEKVVFYIVPRANPDGTECVLTTNSPVVRSRVELLDRTNGLIPQDINNDGKILKMRWQHPLGKYKEYEGDSRVMVRRQPGDGGPFYDVVTEGIINNYDGTTIENGFRVLDFNRNYGTGWKDIDISGKYPFSERETKAIADFGKDHPNIFAGVDIHCGTQAIMRPVYINDYDMNPEDLRLMNKLGKMAEEIIGVPYMTPHDYRQKGTKPSNWPGNSKDWFCYNLGISFFTIELGNGFASSGIFGDEYFNADNETREGEYMARVLKAHDDKNSNIFVPWQEFDHPQLGKVEVGGIIDSYGYYMYPPFIEGISPKVISFIIDHAAYHPELSICNISKDEIAEGIYRVRASVGNIGGFSTRVIKDGGCFETNIPVKVKIRERDKLEILNSKGVYEIKYLNSLGDNVRLEWFVKAKDGKEIIIEASHPRGGTVSALC